MTEPKRDRFGRYILLHPETGKEIAWTRATTFAESVEDTYNLSKWKQRGTAVGIGLRPDLLALAQSLTMDDKKALDEVCEKALNIAKADEKSNLGTALHKMTERLDRGKRFTPPAPYRPDMEAYWAIKRETGMQTRPDYIERITVVPEFGVAGTMDRIVRYDGKLYIADVKTGTDLKYSWGKIAIQLALYSHGHGLWNPEKGQYEPMPSVEQDKAIVIHIPAGTGTAALWWVDIAAGWEAAEVCSWVRGWRKNKALATEFAKTN